MPIGHTLKNFQTHYYASLGVEDGANDQNGDEDHPGDADFCNINASQFTWFNHSQLNRAMSEPLPPVDQTNISMRGSMFRNTQLSALPSTGLNFIASKLHIFMHCSIFRKCKRIGRTTTTNAILDSDYPGSYSRPYSRAICFTSINTGFQTMSLNIGEPIANCHIRGLLLMSVIHFN